MNPEDEEKFRKLIEDLQAEEAPQAESFPVKEKVPEKNSLPELTSDIAFARFLEENLAEFAKGLNARGKLMLITLGRELQSKRPTARLQAARLLGELLGVFKRRKDGGISPDEKQTGAGGEGISEIGAFLGRKDGLD